LIEKGGAPDPARRPFFACVATTGSVPLALPKTIVPVIPAKAGIDR